MTIEKIREMYDAQPFRPFIMHLADGREIPVPHREFLALSPTGRTVIVCGPDEAFSIVDLYLVTDLEFRPKKNPRGKQGPARG
jgi:hypothetical protein